MDVPEKHGLTANLTAAVDTHAEKSRNGRHSTDDDLGARKNCPSQAAVAAGSRFILSAVHAPESTHVTQYPS